MKSEHAFPWGRSAAWLVAIVAAYWAVSAPIQVIPDGILPKGPKWVGYTISSAVIMMAAVFSFCLLISFLGMRLAGVRKTRSIILLAFSMTSVLAILMGAIQWYGATHIPVKGAPCGFSRHWAQGALSALSCEPDAR